MVWSWYLWRRLRIGLRISPWMNMAFSIYYTSLPFRMNWLWPPLHTSTLCACVVHFISTMGGIPSLCHNEIRNLTSTVALNWSMLPELQPPLQILKRGLAWTLPWMVFGVVVLRGVLLVFVLLIYSLHGQLQRIREMLSILLLHLLSCLQTTRTSGVRLSDCARQLKNIEKWSSTTSMSNMLAVVLLHFSIFFSCLAHAICVLALDKGCSSWSSPEKEIMDIVPCNLCLYTV